MHLTKRNPEINKPFVNPHSLTPQFPINEPNYDEWIDPEKKRLISRQRMIRGKMGVLVALRSPNRAWNPSTVITNLALLTTPETPAP